MDNTIIMIALGILSGFVTLCIAVIGYFLRRLIDDMRDLQIQGTKCEVKYEEQKTSVANIRTHISENYATKTDLNASRLETSESLKRVYEKLDALPQIILNLIDRGRHENR